MQCPKCGEEIFDLAVICPRCAYVVDTTQLGFQVPRSVSMMSVEADVVDTQKMQVLPELSSAPDAIVLGGLDEEVELLWSEHTGSFLTVDSTEAGREVVPAPVYVSKTMQQLMRPEAVLLRAPDLDKRTSMLSAFEQHVLSFIDGRRPVARLRKLTGLSADDLRIAVGMLADKGAVVLGGVIKRPEGVDSDEEDEDNGRVGLPNIDDADDPTTEWKPPAADLEDAPPVVVGLPADDEILPPWVDDDAAVNVRPAAQPKAQGARGAAPEPEDHRARAAGFHALAKSEAAKGNRVRAQVYAKLAVESDPDDAAYRKHEAELIKRDRPTASTVSQEAMLLADADDAERHGHHEKAYAILQQAVELNPTSATAWNRLGLLTATRFKRFSEASEALMRAIELQPNNVVFKNNLGKIIALAETRGMAPQGNDDGGLLKKLKRAFG